MVPDYTPTVQGVIVSRDIRSSPATDFLAITVEVPTERCGYVFGVGPHTEIWSVETDGHLIAAGDHKLVAGAHVRVWAEKSGAIIDSCPYYADAAFIELLPVDSAPLP